MKRANLGDMASMVRLVNQSKPAAENLVDQKRQLLADLCRLVGRHVGGDPAAPAKAAGLSPRMRQTLEHLLVGDSEKEIAAKLKVSPHTVHVYVKALHKHFNVSSRGELMARWVRK